MLTAPATLRTATPEDARALLELQHAIYQEGTAFVGDGPPSLEALKRRLRALDPEASLYLVAEGPGRALLGWLELHRHTPWRLRHVAVLTLAVAASARRQGLGRALLRASYGWAGEVGVEKITLHVRSSNRAAISLYECEGFVHEGRERKQVRTAHGYEDNLIMAKFLMLGSGNRA